MRKLLLTLSLVLLSGCATVQTWIPSFWDDNQSQRIIDVRQKVANIDCTKPQLAQSQAIMLDLQWFELYSASKGSLQKDVIRVTAPIKETTADWIKRGDDGSKTYCELKKRILVQQSERAAQAVLGRW